MYINFLQQYRTFYEVTWEYEKFKKLIHFLKYGTVLQKIKASAKYLKKNLKVGGVPDPLSTPLLDSLHIFIITIAQTNSKITRK